MASEALWCLGETNLIRRNKLLRLGCHAWHLCVQHPSCLLQQQHGLGTSAEIGFGKVPGSASFVVFICRVQLLSCLGCGEAEFQKVLAFRQCFLSAVLIHAQQP